MAAVRTRSYGRVEAVYTTLGEGAVARLIDEYWRLGDLRERVLVMDLLFVGAPLAQGRPVYLDMVTHAQRIADSEDAGEFVDGSWALARAVSGLECDRERFGVLVELDPASILSTAGRWLTD